MPITQSTTGASAWKCHRCNHANDTVRNKKRCSSCRSWKDGIALLSASARGVVLDNKAGVELRDDVSAGIDIFEDARENDSPNNTKNASFRMVGTTSGHAYPAAASATTLGATKGGGMDAYAAQMAAAAAGYGMSPAPTTAAAAAAASARAADAIASEMLEATRQRSATTAPPGGPCEDVDASTAIAALESSQAHDVARIASSVPDLAERTGERRESPLQSIDGRSPLSPILAPPSPARLPTHQYVTHPTKNTGLVLSMETIA